MKIELKNIYVYERMSEETTAFEAALYIDGVKVGHTKNTGTGGPNDYYALNDPKSRELLKEAEAYCETLPPIKCGQFNIDSTLEMMIGEMLEDFLVKKDTEKFMRKIQKKTETAIVWGTDKSFSYIDFKMPLKAVALVEKGRESIKNVYKKVMNEHLKEGERIFNTNIPDNLKS